MTKVAIAAPNQWLPLPTPLTLGQHEVHVWCVSLEQEESQVYQLKTLPSHLQCQALFTAWTRKEAYLKAKGLGLSTPSDHVEVTLIPGEPAVLLTVQWNPQEAKCWILQNLKLTPDYVGAVAVEGN